MLRFANRYQEADNQAAELAAAIAELLPDPEKLARKTQVGHCKCQLCMLPLKNIGYNNL